MCGIVGFIDPSWRKKSQQLDYFVTLMADTLRHRGPDDQGIWIDENNGVAFGHRRLSIIDLSQEGHQPMVSRDGRYIIVFNGEVYNFKALRKDLELHGVQFLGHSDTEVVLSAISHYGLEKAMAKFNGMFAFALWDRSDKILYLCRDRLGEKPLYYGFINNSFVFASELKAFAEFPGFDKEINRQAVASYLRYNCIPAPHSIFKNIRKLFPGELLEFDSVSQDIKTHFYWSASNAAMAFDATNKLRTFEDMLREGKFLLKDAVKIRMESDVPLGVFLSGGIDSSLITALMQEQSTVPIKTFTIGFDDQRYNEAQDAKQVAEYLGTDHTCFHATAKDALKVIPELPKIYDEPFADSSQIPTILVSRLAKQHVTVCVSGDGGDEIFGGYNRHVWLDKIWKKIELVPHGVRRSLSSFLSICSPDKFEAGFESLKQILPEQLRVRSPGIKFQKFLDCLAALNEDEAYLNLTSHWKNSEEVVLGDFNRLERFAGLSSMDSLGDLKRQMMYCDMTNYLPNDILTKVDRASMSASLESRAVFLDHRLVEYAWKLPTDVLINKNGSKLILRNILSKYLPATYWERPKMGFAVPLDDWLRGPLKDWADDLLSSDYLRRKGFFDHKIISQKWQEHKKGSRNWQFELWDILMFNAWLEFNHINS
ncbi:MAG TPA: asparagine synthase (glutamine-hydrolyzing) [Candidatus Omnitrophota bacterium]|nr:asparagine synthase (glutamine-hydrolyzing) [Candidatus Omnitrophota bacterium]